MGPDIYRRRPPFPTKPGTYGTPEDFATLLDSWAALVDREPPETFANTGARTAARHLAERLIARAHQADEGETAEDYR